MQDVVIAGGVRTAIGSFQGSLRDKSPTDLGTIVVSESLRRAEVDPAEVGHVVFGNVIHTEPKDMYLSRVSALGAGIPKETPAMTLNRLCGSGIQAVVSAAQMIALGDAEIAVAGGAECMSRAPHSTQAIRSGSKMGDMALQDMMLGALNDPFGAGHMGITAENIAEQWQISRAEQDRFAAESQRRAGQAIAEKRFTSQIIGIEVRKGREIALFDTDEHPKPGATADSLATLKGAFRKDGTVTAGNASGINDGAAALVIASEDRTRLMNRKPLARIVAYAHAGVEPSLMGIGPVPAVRKLFERTGLTVGDFDVIESNEAFAAQACAVIKDLGLPEDRTNPNGGAIALGHPVGATGAIIIVKALYELQRIGGRRALCTMCIGGGQGIALAIEAAA
jgi:acetyl-CoA C-acetyltransferase